MKLNDFKLKFKNKNKFDNNWNYIISSLAIIGGLFILYKLSLTEYYELKFSEKKGKILSKNVIYFSGIMLILIGVYGFWRIPKLYKLYVINTNYDISKNKELITEISNKFRMELLENKNNYYCFIYYGKFKNPFNIYFFLENDKIFLNVQQIDYDGGFIDFGNSKKVMSKIISELNLNTKI